MKLRRSWLQLDAPSGLSPTDSSWNVSEMELTQWRSSAGDVNKYSGGQGLYEQRTGRLETLALEDMSEMSAARGTGDLDAGHTPRVVFVSGNSARNS